ncbi:MAG: hypothetical protein Q7S43_03035 [bacterium]|nr:hypothetical protein [bacterium]MDO8496403.1 hypothetical protein [bacterium]
MMRFLVGTTIVILSGALALLGVSTVFSWLLAFTGFSIQASALFQLKRRIDFTDEIIKQHLEISSELRAIREIKGG